jgi:hypothetical protein
MIEHDFLNNKNPTNPKVGPSEDKVSVPYVLCAAIWFKDGKKYEHQPKNVDSGIVICGRRHHNCFLTAYELNGGKKIIEKIGDDINRIVQGFLTSDDRFVDRKESAMIAFNAGQTAKAHDHLISEDLY